VTSTPADPPTDGLSANRTEAGAPPSGRVPAAPVVAEVVFGAALSRVGAYAQLLAGPAVERGLLGPREVDRLWERHLLNSAVVAALLPAEGLVIDLGSGAGLPGIVLALLRPDLEIVLIDATRRRVEFLDEAVSALGVSNVRTLWGRAENLKRQLVADVVVARAVAPLEVLVPWAAGLLKRSGEILAIKGERAEAELAQAAPVLARLGLVADVVPCGVDVLAEPAIVVRMRRRTM
jgi:16S rRNA (guanine527-N7)-methyltransferase